MEKGGDREEGRGGSREVSGETIVQGSGESVLAKGEGDV